MTNDDLVSRLKQYETFLTGEVKRFRDIAEEESLAGSITAQAEAKVLETARDRLYQIFPDVYKTQTQNSEPKQ